MAANSTPATSISVVTAVYNGARRLPRLIESLRAQSDMNFEWVIADGGSSDGTLELLQSVTDLRTVVSSQPDFGIYDALNRAVRLSSGTHYIVAGSDDWFRADALANFRRAIDESRADIIAAQAVLGGRLRTVRKGPSWLHGAHSFVAHHTLSAAIRKDLHDKYSMYTRSLPIAADALFIIRACQGGARRHEADFVAGEVGFDGVSAVDWAGSATEFFRVQLMTGGSFTLQVLLLIARLVKGASGATRQLQRRDLE